MDIRSSFEMAVAESKTLSQRPGNTDLLKLYSLYKQGTEGDISSTEPSNPFDFVAKAKYNAWAELKGLSKEAAMQQYIDLVNTLKG